MMRIKGFRSLPKENSCLSAPLETVENPLNSFWRTGDLIGMSQVGRDLCLTQSMKFCGPKILPTES